MGRLIDRDALIDDCKKYLNKLNPSRDGKECTRIHWLIGILSNAPTIEERKTGKWEIYVISQFDGEGCRCSECKYEGAPYWNFCPNCGVVMSGGKNG